MDRNESCSVLQGRQGKGVLHCGGGGGGGVTGCPLERCSGYRAGNKVYVRERERWAARWWEGVRECLWPVTSEYREGLYVSSLQQT